MITFKNEKDQEIDARKFRMFNHLTKHNKINKYHMQLKMPDGADRLEMRLGGNKNVAAKVRSVVIKGCKN